MVPYFRRIPCLVQSLPNVCNDLEYLAYRVVSYITYSGISVIFAVSSMPSNLLKMCGNRAALDENASAPQEIIEKEKSIVEYLEYRYEERGALWMDCGCILPLEGRCNFASTGNQPATLIS